MQIVEIIAFEVDAQGEDITSFLQDAFNVLVKTGPQEKTTYVLNVFRLLIYF
jgi:hypothetical protein